MLPTRKSAPAHRFGDAMTVSCGKGSGMGTPSLKLKGGMYSSPEIHGFSPVGSQYGIFGPVPRYFPRNLQKPETRPIFAMAKMSPRESHFLAVGVVRWAPNLHMFNSTHQDLTLHRECRLISDGITPYCLEKYAFL